MFFDTIVLSRQHNSQLYFAWLSATRGVGILKRDQIIDCRIDNMCNFITNYLTTQSNRTRQRFSLRFSSILINGVVKIYKKKVIITLDEIIAFLRNPSNLSRDRNDSIVGLRPPRKFQVRTKKPPPKAHEKKAIKSSFEFMLVVQNNDSAIPRVESRPNDIQSENILNNIQSINEDFNADTDARELKARRLVSDKIEESSPDLGSQITEVVVEVHRELSPITGEEIRNAVPPDVLAPPESIVLDSANAELPAVQQSLRSPSEPPELGQTVEPATVQSSESTQEPIVKKRKRHVKPRVTPNGQTFFLNNRIMIKNKRIVRINRVQPDEDVRYTIEKKMGFDVNGEVTTFHDMLNKFLAEKNVDQVRPLNTSISPTTSMNGVSSVKDKSSREPSSVQTRPHQYASLIPSPTTSNAQDLIPIANDIPIATELMGPIEINAASYSQNPEGTLTSQAVDSHVLKQTMIENYAHAGCQQISPMGSEIIDLSTVPESRILTDLTTIGYHLRQQKIIEQLRMKSPLKFEYLCEKPVNKLSAARCFNDLLVLYGAGYVQLIQQENSTEIEFVDLGCKFNA